MTQSILCVDDDAYVLQGFRRRLRQRYALETATGPEEALEVIQRQGPFAVVVSDMQMPRINGVEFLRRVRALAPDTVRMMLTGNADQQTAVDAVNDGCIFRFLCKPCTPEALSEALDAGLAQYRLIRHEKELLSNTLNGSVRLLTEVLSLVNPTSFGCGDRVRRIIRQIGPGLGLANAWEIELAAMLSQVGCVAVPAEVMHKAARGEPLSPDEDAVFRRHPQIGRDLVAKIPRLERVARMIAGQFGPLDPPVASASTDESEVTRETLILMDVVEFEQLTAAGHDADAAVHLMRANRPEHDERTMRALAAIPVATEDVRFVSVSQLVDGMIFEEQVHTKTGLVLVGQGHEVVEALRQRLEAYASSPLGVREPIRVRCPRGTPPTGDPSPTSQSPLNA